MIGDPTERYGFRSGQGRDTDITLADGAIWLSVLGIILVALGFGLVATTPSKETINALEDHPFPVRPADPRPFGR